MKKSEQDHLPSIDLYPPKTLEILQLIRQEGGMLCTGSCHHQKKGDLHCRQIGKILEMGFSTVWDRVNYLIREGLVDRCKPEKGPVSFNITPRGEDVLRQAGLTG